MKISLNWLNQYLDRHIDADEAEQLLTDQGFPLDGREEVEAGDAILDVEVTSNRSDCLSHVGLAREVAAGSNRQLQTLDYSLDEGNGPAVASVARIETHVPDICPLYTARVICGVTIGPSPDWMAQRLETVGLRSVNNVVDITNYVLLEMGQPLHAFDLTKLAEQRIVVRMATKGESFTAIDGTTHQMKRSMLVIADADRPVAVAGVMGGQDSEVGETTCDILLESAIFDPLSVRQTSRALKLSSDSSYRFERGIDPHGVDAASRRAAGLIIKLAGGTLAKGVIRVGMAEPTPRQVEMRVARCNQLLGISVSSERMIELLKRLALQPRRTDSGGETIICTIPTYRLDLAREVDLIEEVARLHGLDQVPMQKKISIEARRIQPIVAARQKMSQALVAHGYHETVTFSFVHLAHGRVFLTHGEEAVSINDTRRKAEPMLRPSLLPSLLTCRKSNQDAGNKNVHLFETGSTWRIRGGHVVEREHLALLSDAPEASTALRALRGVLEESSNRLAANASLVFEPMSHDQYAACAKVLLDGEAIGHMGQLSASVQELFDIQVPLVSAEIQLRPLLDRYPPSRTVQALPRLPSTERDLSVIVSEAVQWAQIDSEIRRSEPALLESIMFLGTYRGRPIAKGQKSVSVRLLFRDPSQTLRHYQVEPQMKAIVNRLEKFLGAELRN